MKLLLRQEVDLLVAGYSSPCLGLFGLFAGAFGSLLVANLTVVIPNPSKRYFVDSTVITGCLSIVFLMLAIREWWKARKVVTDLENEEGVEVDVAVQAQPAGTKQL